MSLPTSCDYELSPDTYCDGTIHFYALTDRRPEGWGGDYRAALAGFCCLEHANHGPRPELEAAQRTYGAVVRNGAFTPLWRLLIDAFPDPVPACVAIEVMGDEWIEMELQRLRDRWRREPENRRDIEALAARLTANIKS